MTKSTARRPGDDRQPALRQGPRAAQPGRARAGRRRGFRRPHARALGAQEEAVELDVQRPDRPAGTTSAATTARSAASWSAPVPAASCCSTPRTPAGCAPRWREEGLAEVRFSFDPTAAPSSSGTEAPPVQCVILAGGLGTPDVAGGADRPEDAAAGRRPALRRLAARLAGRGGHRPRSSTASATSATRSGTTSATARAWGLTVRYVDEGDRAARHRRRAPAGPRRRCAGRAVPRALRRLLAPGRPGGGATRQRSASDAPALMTVFENDGRWDASNVVFAGGRVRPLREGPGPATARDALDRLRAVGPDQVDRGRTGPPGTVHDLAELFTALSARGELAGYLVDRRFYEIGSPRGWPRSPTSSPAEADRPQVVVASCGSGASASLNSSRSR